MQNFNYQGNAAAPYQPYQNEQIILKTQRIQERRTLRKASNGVGFFVLVYFLVMIVSAKIFSNLAMALILVTEENQNILNNYIQIIYPTLSPLIAGLLYRILSGRRLSDAFPKSHVPLKKLVPIVLLGMAVAMIANQFAVMFDNNISLFSLKNNVPDMEESTTSLEMIFSFVATAIVPAFAEEFAFRGIVMGTLRKHGDAFAIVASALLFGAMHGNTTQIIFAFTLGLILGYADCKANSIIPSVIMHFANNFYAILHECMRNALHNDATVLLVFNTIIALFYALGILAFIYLARADKGFFKLTNTDNDQNPCGEPFSLKSKITAFLTTPGVIICLCLFLMETIQFLIPESVSQAIWRAIGVE